MAVEQQSFCRRQATASERMRFSEQFSDDEL
jgi:hypothetical protein